MRANCTQINGARQARRRLIAATMLIQLATTTWVPSEHIGYDATTGSYAIDAILVQQIENDFTILENDSAVLVESGVDDYFELSGVASGDLADLFGLQNGDILLSLNNYSLNGIANAMAAHSAVENDSTLVLSFERSGSVYSHTYHIAHAKQRQWRR